MRIAHVVPHSVVFPLANHNGRYSWVIDLAARQAQAGHEVTIYGGPGSSDKRIIAFRSATLEEQSDALTANIATFAEAFANEHDVYHSHFDSLHYRVAHLTTKPILFTQHWWPNDEIVGTAQSARASNVWAVPPTADMAQYDTDSGIAVAGHIYHGIDIEVFTPAKVQKQRHLLFVGRIAPDKNLELALEVASRGNIPLHIIGKIPEKNQQYWHDLQPLVARAHASYLGQKDQHELIEAYSAAQAVICPFSQTEAFGLVAVEAQACGTPILITAGGSHPELLNNGKTGYICTSVDEFVAAFARTSSLLAEDCIAFTAATFDVRRMAAQYLALYDRIVSLTTPRN